MELIIGEYNQLMGGIAMSAEVMEHSEVSGKLMHLLAGSLITQSIYTVARLRIPDLLAERPLTCQELAELTQTQASPLYRVMRFLCGEGIFHETEDKTFELGPLGQVLRSDTPDSLHASALMFGQPWHMKPACHLIDTLTKGIPPFEAAHGMDIFTYFSQHPEDEQIFQNTMSAYSRRIIPAVLGAYDFSQFATVIDIGGGHGILMEQLLRSCKNTRGIVFDQPAVIEGTKQFMKRSGLEDRCKCVGGSFFESVPEGAEAYIMKHIIHDWSDEESVAILSNCRKAMGNKGKLLLLEIVLDSGNETNYDTLVDMEMLTKTTGKERTQAEFEQLYLESGFRLSRVVPTSSTVSIIEGVPI